MIHDTIVDQALADFDKVLDWLEIEPEQRRYPWSAEEDQELKRWYGRVSRGELAAKVTTVLRRVTGDPEAERTQNAVATRAQQMGLVAYGGSQHEVYLREAARQTGVDYKFIFDVVRSDELPTTKRGKQRYVSYHDLALWFVDFRERQLMQAEALDAIEGEETISKQEAMKLTGLSETHITRYLQTGIITAWQIPNLGGKTRNGEWRVQRVSAEAFVTARSEGRLQEVLNSNETYVALRNEITAEIRSLRHKGRLAKRDPLTTPESRYHPGCFTIKQVASHVGLSPQVLYEAIKAGNLTAVSVVRGGRPRYAIEPEEARRYAKWVKARDKAAVRWHDKRRRAIAAAGLLTVKDLTKRWGVSEATAIARLKQAGVPTRTWGRYLVVEQADIEAYEADVRWSVAEIAKKWDCTPYIVRYRLDKAGIPFTRNQPDKPKSRRLYKKQDILDYESRPQKTTPHIVHKTWERDRRLLEESGGLAVFQIAERWGIEQSVALRYLDRRNVSYNTIGHFRVYDPKTIEKLEAIRNRAGFLTVGQVAARLGWSRFKTAWQLDKADVPYIKDGPGKNAVRLYKTADIINYEEASKKRKLNGTWANE